MPGSQLREVHTVATDSQAQEVLLTRDGPVMTLTFNRPEARNALTWNMYERLYQTCEEVDADDSVRVLVLRGAGGKAFVAGTDISQFKSFKTAEDGIQYERDGERRTGRLERVGKPVIAQIEGFAVGGGLPSATSGSPLPSRASGRPSPAPSGTASPWRTTRASWTSSVPRGSRR